VTVRAKELEVCEGVVDAVPIDVMKFERDRATQPLRAPAALTSMLENALRDQSTPKLVRVVHLRTPFEIVGQWPPWRSLRWHRPGDAEVIRADPIALDRPSEDVIVATSGRYP